MWRLYSQIYSAFSLTFILLTHKISMYNQLNNKPNHTKAHHFYLLSTYNSEHIILISSQKKLYGNKCKSNERLWKKNFWSQKLIKLLFQFSLLNFVKDMWWTFLSMRHLPKCFQHIKRGVKCEVNCAM